MRDAGLVQYDFELANRVFFDNAEPIRECMTDIFDNDIQMVDFADNAEAVRQKINQWVEKITKDKIKDFLTPELVNSQTRMAIVSNYVKKISLQVLRSLTSELI